MKKYFYTVIAASCAMFASCSQEGEFASQTENPQGKAITEISASSGVESRAVVDGTKINWESGDQLGVFSTGTSATAYTLDGTGGGTSGTFKNETTPVSSISACMYPAQSTATWSDSKLTCNIPTVQTATASSFDRSAAIMYYIGDNTAVTLNSAVAFLKVTVSESNVHAITISSASTVLSGDIEITKSGDNYSIDAASKGTVKSVTLVAPAASGKTYDNCLEAGKTYYIAVLPGTIASPSISYTYINSDSHTATVKTKAGSSNLEVSAAHVKTIGVSSWTGATEKTAVQLWENGPYFAQFNVGSAITNYAGATNYTTANVGGLYTWGGTNDFNVTSGYPSDDHYTGTEDPIPSNYDTAARLWSSAWCMPEKAALDNLCAGISSGTGTGTYTKWTWLDGTGSNQYASGCTIKGYKIEGVASGYTSNSVFFPVAGYYLSSVDNQGNYGSYWSSTPSGSSEAYGLGIDTVYGVVLNNGSRSYGFSVRAVLK